MTDDEAMDYIERNCSEPPVDDDERPPICPHCTAMAESARMAEERLARALEGAKKARAERDELQAQLDIANSSEAALEHERTLRELADTVVERDRLREALKSIAGNTCCDGCQEAARVAARALASGEES